MTQRADPSSLPLRLNALIEQLWFTTFNSQQSPLIWFSFAIILMQWPEVAQVIGFSSCLVVSFVLLYMRSQRNGDIIKDWSKEVIVITGGANGIGESLGKRLLSVGAKVIVIDVMKADYGISYGADLNDLDCIEPMITEIIEKHKPTMLVNNVGIMIAGSFSKQPLNQLHKLMNINFMSYMYMSRCILPYFLKNNRGHILCTSSVMGVTGANNAVAYCASKFAVSGLCEALRQETLKTNVFISCIYPGLIDTGMFQGVAHKFEYATPPLTTRMVSDEMFEMLSGKRSSNEFLPFYAKLSPALIMLSPEVNDAFHELMGANHDLSGFTGSASAKKLTSETMAEIKLGKRQ